jgi:hypothetical protein
MVCVRVLYLRTHCCFASQEGLTGSENALAGTEPPDEANTTVPPSRAPSMESSTNETASPSFSGIELLRFWELFRSAREVNFVSL